MSEFRLPTSAEMTRLRPLHGLLAPFRERRFLYSHYEAFLDRLTDPSRFLVVPLREFRKVDPATRALVGLRHDVDARLNAALVFAQLEHTRGLRSTYFVLHTAPYWQQPGLLESLRRLEELGHEVGFHYDLVTVQVVDGLDPRAVLASELARLRGAGLRIVGAAAHGSYWGHRLGYKNDYFFRELDEAHPDFPNNERVGEVELAKGTLGEFGFTYDAMRLGENHYWSDSWMDRRGRRWHPELLDLDVIGPRERAIVLVHPDHWDRSLAAKLTRTARRGFGRLAGLRR